MKLEKKYKEQKRELEKAKSDLLAMQEKIEYINSLVSELETLRTNWMELIQDLKDKRIEYDILLSQLKEIRSNLI